MLVPLSWLREYIEIKMSLPKLIARLSEVGVGVENIHKKEEDTILELEITPNRPDLLSVVGVAREVAAMQSTNRILTITPPPLPTIPKARKKLPITIKNNFSLCERFTGIIIDRVTVKESPLWLSTALESAGLRPINNIVDITNFVLLELGNPIHAFDYNQIQGHVLTVEQAAGGEPFTSVDNIAYKLPKGAIIIKDKKHIIDLCGIKGGVNSGITKKTKTIFLRIPIDDGKLIRKTTQALSLRSEASSIFERGANKGGTLDALMRTVSLVRKLAGGTVASSVIDLKKQQFNPWHLTLSLDRLAKMLGISIDEPKVVKILTALNLSPQKVGHTVKVTVPTYRNDLQIEEDLIEEVARMYGYNKFPKMLPKGEMPTADIPYQSTFPEEFRIKQVLTSLGLSEINTYSLVSREDAKLVDIEDEKKVFVANPVSREFEVMRPSLLISLLKAIPQNSKYQEDIRLFELGKIYRKDGNTATEQYSLAAVCYPADYYDAKGLVEALFEALSVPLQFRIIEIPNTYHKKRSAGLFVGKEKVGIVGEISKRVLQTLGMQKSVACFKIDFDLLLTLLPKTKLYQPIPKYPPLIEDLSIVVDREVLTGHIMHEIQEVNPLVATIDFLDVFEDTRTFRITFQHPERNLSSPEVSIIRHQILRRLKQKFGAQLKS